MDNSKNEATAWRQMFIGLGVMALVFWLIGEMTKPSQAEKDQKAYELHERTLKWRNRGLMEKRAARRVMERECERNPTSRSCADAIIAHDEVYIMGVSRNPYAD